MDCICHPYRRLLVDLFVVKNAEWFAPSGAVTLFAIAFVQSWQWSRMHTKHFRNLERLANGDPVEVPSVVYKKLEKRLFVLAAYGTLIWAFGDKLVEFLVRFVAA